MTTLTPTDRSAHDLKVDAAVFATYATDDGATLADGHGLPTAAARHITEALRTLGSKGSRDEVVVLTGVPKVKAPKVVLTGLGRAEDTGGDVGTDGEALRRGAGAALRSLAGAATVAVSLPHDNAAELAAVAEGAYAGAYTFTTHKSTSVEAAETAVTVVSTTVKGRQAKDVMARASALGAATAYARDLVNTAPNVLYPESFAESVAARAKSAKGKVTLEVLDEKALADGGFGGIVGVGQGSSRPPRIVVMTYAPRSKKVPSVALVGKGITFDSGGVNLKPSTGMLTMKSDMAGAAAVAGAVFAAADLGLPVKVTGYLCLAENMPGGNAQRPGDVVTMRNGRTVEIVDTDAEGRMVLGDGICLASEAAPDAIVDVATLTGACVVALGTRVAGVMGHDAGFRGQVLEAGRSSGEASWPLPLPDDLRAMLESQVADIAHKGERWGGTLTAALFLGDFVGEKDGAPIPWAHIDIAGPSFNEGKPWGHTPKGGTGYGVATLLRVIEEFAG